MKRLSLLLLTALALTDSSSAAPKTAPPRPATVLLITHKSLKRAWQDFADWKTKLGKATKIVTVSDIKKRYKAKSVQEQIRLCVRDHIDHRGTRWVILGGDAKPGGQGLVPGGHRTVHRREPQGIPTDIVYLSPSNWDADGDGIYGEWDDDREAISYPDGSVGLGRIPVRSAADVAAFTDKVKAYESRYPEGKFATKMVYTCTERPAYPKVRKSWDGYLSKVWSQGQAARFFSDETPWDKRGPGSYALSSKNLVSLFNSKSVGKVHIHGHGLLPLWVLEGSRFTAKHVSQLKHDGAYPLITTVSCFTGQYDGAQDPSIVESMLRQPKGGSVAIVAPVRTGKPHFAKRSDFRLMVTQGKLDGTTLTRYWSHGLGPQQLTTGEAFMRAKADMAKDGRRSPAYHLCLCELNLLGDPSLDMRAQSPRRPRLKAPKTLAVGRQSLSVTTDCPGADVCLWQASSYQVVKADAKGRARFKLRLKAGTAKLTVFGPSLNAVSKTLSVGVAAKKLY